MLPLKQRVEGVRAFRLESRAESTREAAATAHLFRQISQPTTSYLCIPRHVSETRPYFLAQRFPADVICSDANFLAADPDGFDFAIISSAMFIVWQKTVGGRIKSDLRFNKLLTWNTFPLPNVIAAQRQGIIDAGAAVIAARQLQKDVSLAEMYAPGMISGPLSAAHSKLDSVVDALFGLNGPALTELQRQDALFKSYESIIAKAQ